MSSAITSAAHIQVQSKLYLIMQADTISPAITGSIMFAIKATWSQVRELPVALCCVLEQDTLTQEDRKSSLYD